MSYQLYHQSIESATLTYSATADTNYPATNMQDRYKNTFFKDTGIGADCDIKIDFGANRTCDYILLGNYFAIPDGGTTLTIDLQRDDNAGFASPTTVFSTENIYSATLTKKLKTFTSCTDRYWRILFKSNTGVTEVDNLQIGTIFLGTAITLSHSPELDVAQSADYLVNVNQGVGGIRSGSIDNTTVRRLWSYPWKLLSETDKTNLQTFRDSVYMNKDLSRYPFWWSPDTGTTLYYARTKGALDMKQQAYQAWTWDANFEEEL
uniref:Uncharacterized protein n=2 Tax=viral metagenome TaxID=1070528 RepID=A0A6H1ZPX3_9ZZZZ